LYQSFKVSNFRCFDELDLSGLERLNLIAGKNNIGKTALLEALFIHSGPYNPELIMRIDALRGIEYVKIELGRFVGTPWDSIFRGFDSFKTVELAGQFSEMPTLRLRIRVIRQPEELMNIRQYIQPSSDERDSPSPSSEGAHVLELESRQGKKINRHYMILDLKGPRIAPIPPPHSYKGVFLAARGRVPPPTDAERLGKLEIVGKQDVLLRALQEIDQRIRKISVITVSGVPIIHGDVGMERLIPLPIMGEGMVRLSSLVLAIGDAQNGVVFIDEIENGLHNSVLPKVWSVIGQTAREFNTQIFATTHSLECIAAAHKAFTRSQVYDFRLIRLERVQETIRALTYDQETLSAALETGLEVR